MNFAVFGAGGWGTALARLLARKGYAVRLWARRAPFAEELDELRENRQYLPGVSLPRDHLMITADLQYAVKDAEVVLLAVPSFAVREIARKLRAHAHPQAWINLAKGLERDSLLTMSAVLEQELGPQKIFTLSGPSHAEEVGRDFPTSVVLAGTDLALGEKIQRALMSERFRVYLSDDLVGVEYGGAVKNVIALAAGILDGLGYGDNAKAALIARGLAEMVRLGVKLGARRETFFGLSGVGDLVATCTSEHSRNRRVGYRLGRGESLQKILESMTMVAEGVYATASVRKLARQHGVEVPITEAVYAVLYEGASPLDQLHALMTREPKREIL
ncbi:MAG: NAD(P)-dependent glycerol-3-phosphate dehydrogenase [Candidatus Bipolaricaulota bacterium]|nr:NAD(P)-dependent glycerol-3-phosphate dehydrogenase [Candidatus Bipolaricaulota bacterium]